MAKLDLTTASAAIAIVTGLDLICLVAIIICYSIHGNADLIKFLHDAFSGFNGALLMAARSSTVAQAPKPQDTDHKD